MVKSRKLSRRREDPETEDRARAAQCTIHDARVAAREWGGSCVGVTVGGTLTGAAACQVTTGTLKGVGVLEASAVELCPHRSRILSVWDMQHRRMLRQTLERGVLQ